MSDWRNVTAVMAAVTDCRPGGRLSDEPMSILDVGPGYGKYGVLFRELTDGGIRYAIKDRKSRIDCVEIWRPYISPLHTWIYDTVYIEDFGETFSRYKDYDCVFMGDVIEHFEKNLGLEILNTVRKNNRNVVLCVPAKSFVESSQTLGGCPSSTNPHEAHRALWDETEIEDAFFYATQTQCFVCRTIALRLIP